MIDVVDFVRTLDDAFPRELCDKLIGAYDAEPRAGFDADFRRCGEYTAMLEERPALFEETRNALQDLLVAYRKEVQAPTLGLITEFSVPIVFRYEPVGGDARGPNRFHLHSDAWNGSTSARVVSVIVYLNDVPRGGETKFPRLGIAIRPSRGRALLFPSAFVYEHEGLQPVGGPKYILVAWFHFARAETSLRTFAL